VLSQWLKNISKKYYLEGRDEHPENKVKFYFDNIKDFPSRKVSFAFLMREIE